MDDHRTIVTDVEFALADAEWRHEIETALGYPFDEDGMMPSPIKGEPGTVLRRAFDERQRAFRAWRDARGLA